MKHAFPLYLLVFLTSMHLGGCEGGSKKEAWKPYNQRIEEEETARRKKVGLKGRTVQTPMDSTGKMLTVAIDSFDADGHLIFSRTFKADGNVAKETRHVYEKGLQMGSSQLDERGIIKIDFFYDADGKRTHEWVVRQPADTMLGRRYVYDAEGREVEAFFERRENGMKARKVTEYDKESRPVKVMEYESDRLNWQEIYTYKDKRQMGAERLDGFSTLQGKFEMDFDSLGHCTRMEQWDGHSRSKLKVINTYNADGLLIMEESYTKGELYSISEMTYDPKGMLLSKRSISQGVATELRYLNRY